MFGVSNYNKAIELYNADKYEEAIPKFIKAITSGELDAGSLYNGCAKLGFCCIETNDYDSAIFYLKEALRWETENYFVYFHFGRVYYLKNEYDLSLQYFNTSIEKYEHHLSWYWKGKIFSEQDKIEDAEDAFRTALRLAVSQGSNNVGFIQTELNQILKRKEKYLIKKAEYDRTNQIKERIKEYVNLQKRGKYREAISNYNRLLEEYNLEPRYRCNIHYKLGECYREIKQYHTAISEFKAALDIDSKFSKAIFGLINTYLARGQFAEAIDELNKHIQLIENELKHPKSVVLNGKKESEGLVESLRGYLVLIQLIQDRKYEELLDLCTGTDGRVEDTDALPLIGAVLHKLRRYDELLTTITPHLDDGGDDGMYASYVGIAHYQKKHYETAIRYLDRGIENGNGDDSDTWGYKGECHFFLGEYEKAIDAYQKSIEVRIPNEDEDFEITYLEERIRTAKQKLAQEKAKVVPSHITIQGNSAPINLGGILATDDAVINRAKVAEGSGTAAHSAFCPGCGSPVEEGDLFCRKCGRRL